MCGIAGYIGLSKNQAVTYDIITNVFSKTESRGTDAAGFWGTDPSGKVFYHKEPIRSSELVKNPAWQQLKDYNLDMLLVHARAASQGVGEPRTNKNNHPFTSTDKEISLVHNGRIPEFDYLKQKFQVLSDCDSEILLRIIESGDAYEDTDIAKEFSGLLPQVGRRMMGIRDVFSLINHGHMAVAFGERLAEGRNLWLFRNRHRSMWLVDLRESLGQVFFCSTPDIWQDALSECDTNLGSVQKLIELPSEEVWHFSITNQELHPSRVNRYQVCRESKPTKWTDDGPCPVQRREAKVEVVTKLNEQEECYAPTVKKKEKTISLRQLKKRCSGIKEVVSRIRTAAYNKAKEQSITEREWEELIESLQSAERDLAGTLRLL